MIIVRLNGGLGNQLFQYSFLRTQAERLGVKFYCPNWIGDEIFDLNDKKQEQNEHDAKSEQNLNKTWTKRAQN